MIRARAPERVTVPGETAKKERTASICCMFIVFGLARLLRSAALLRHLPFRLFVSLIKWRDLLVVAGNTWSISVVPPARSLWHRLIVPSDASIYRVSDTPALSLRCESAFALWAAGYCYTASRLNVIKSEIA